MQKSLQVDRRRGGKPAASQSVPDAVAARIAVLSAKAGFFLCRLMRKPQKSALPALISAPK